MSQAGAVATPLLQQPTFTVTQRGSIGSSAVLPSPRILPAVVGDGLLPRTRAQLPRWYLVLRQVGLTVPLSTLYSLRLVFTRGPAAYVSGHCRMWRHTWKLASKASL